MLRALLPTLLSAEPRWLRSTAVGVALLITITFAYSAACFWVPAHGGVDQNGYLVGGKQLARTGTMKQRPTLPGTDRLDPHQFVGRMWVGAELLTDRERYYPKYPAGLPLLYAIALWIGGAARGPLLAYCVSPAAMTVAVWMTFWLARRLGGSIAGLFAMLLFATSPVTVALTTNPNSHAAAAGFVVSGMFFLIQWFRTFDAAQPWRRGAWRPILAGFLLGYAVTIRYSEGTLLLPMLLAVLFKLKLRSRAALIHSLLLAAGWLIPVGALVAYNLGAMGTITGYDPTNESSGFSLEYAIDNWETMLRQLATTGVFFALPLALAGMIGIWCRSWRIAAIITAWVLPCMIVYTFYYWAPDTSTVGYVRFFLTIMPALCALAAWAARVAVDLAGRVSRGAATGTLAAITAIFLIATAAQLRQGLDMAETDQITRLVIHSAATQIAREIPNGSAVFCTDGNLLHHLQFIRDYLLYQGETFQRSQLNALISHIDPNEPQGLDPQRREALAARFKSFDQKKLEDEQLRVIGAALTAGRRVFWLIPLREGIGLPRRTADAEPFRRGWPDLLRRLSRGKEFDATIISAWNVPYVRPVVDRGAPRMRRNDWRPDRRAGYWQVVELTRKPPATRPSTTRATK